MAEYKVTLFLNSGFNAVNIPDSVATLNASAAHIEVDPVEILQNRFLAKVRINADWSTVKDCDYCKIGNFYYSVSSVNMLSESTAELSLNPDFILSAGGTKEGNATFQILDGVTERQTVSEDNFGEYTDDDPLTTPQRPLRLFTAWLMDTSRPGFYTYISTTLDLRKQGQNKEGVTYTDQETGKSATVPKTYQIDNSQVTKIGFAGVLQGDITDGTKYYIRDDGSNPKDEAIESGIAQARVLGIENSIIDQWSVPKIYVDNANTGDPFSPTSVIGAAGSFDVPFPFEWNQTVKNKRLEYGEYCKYGIITTSGNSMEAAPEVLKAGNETAPTIDWRSDPRPEGKPYFRFHSMNGDTEFWRNCIAGSKWQKVPLVYQGQSGTALTRLNFDNDRAMKKQLKSQFMNDNEIDRFQNTLESIGNAFTGSLGGAAKGFKYGGLIGAGEGAVKSILGTAYNYEFSNTRLENDRDYYKANYALEKKNELSQLYQDTTVYTPTVNFPYESDIIRDVKGNGVLVYRYEYDPYDADRIDKLLTMYGYKETESLTMENFNRRQKFDYVQCSSVTVTGLPRWWNDGIGDQLRNGIRIWHVKPDPSAYTNNPIK